MRCFEASSTLLKVCTELSTSSARALARSPGIKISPRDYLEDFSRRSQILISAALEQAKATASTKGYRGRPQLDWYDDFTDLIVQMATLCGIRPTISTNRETGQKGGPFVDLARALERLLVKEMRAPSKVASIKRLERGLRRNRQRQKSATA